MCSKSMVSLRDKMLDTAPLLCKSTDDAIFSATWLVEDAFLGVSRPMPVSTETAHQIYVLHSKFELLERCIMYFLVFMTFIQTPDWCDESKAFPCGDPSDPSTPMTFHMNYLTHAQSRSVEVGCLMILLIHALVPYLYLHDRFLTRPESCIQLGLICASLVDLMLTATWSAYNPVASLHLHEYIRIGFVLTIHPALRRSLCKILLVLSEIYSILSLVLVFILFYSWMAIILFGGTPEGKAQMPNMTEASWHFLILITTSNFPDVMMPAYNENRAACLFFIMFLCFGLFFLMNVVLAIIFNNFSRYSEVETASRQARRADKLTQAFHILAQIDKSSSDQVIPLDVCVRMFVELDRCHHISFMHKTKMHDILASLDTNGDNQIELSEFLETCDVLERLLFVDNQVFRSEMEICFPLFVHTTAFQSFREMVHSKAFEWFIDGALVVNAILVLVESSSVMYGDVLTEESTPWDGWNALEIAFTTLYVVEMVVKIIVDGSRKYLASGKNRFDCIITVAVVGIDLYTHAGSQPNRSPQLIRVFLIARCLRLFRLIVHIKGYRVIFTTWFRLVKFGLHLVALLFCHMYIFALLGNQLFGGRISPAVMRAQFPNDPYTQADYMANNFNDMPGAMVSLFELILVNNWFVLADGHAAVTSKYARWFFIAYHVLGVTFLLNLLIASILDAFIDEYKQEHAKTATTEHSTQTLIPAKRVQPLANYGSIDKMSGGVDEIRTN
ncbi:hypothetical protein AeRB84_020897 [Aphanomyces euteiches]|nr:hypothetical protein AeRB84_020897 [Aphanomyces euteiches]